MTFNPIYLLSLANIFYFCSYAVRDILWLRIIAITAILVETWYFWITDEGNFSVILLSNVMFVSVNVYQSVSLIEDRINSRLTVEEQRIYNQAFWMLKPIEFKKLYKAGRQEFIKPGNIILEQGKQFDSIYFLQSGTASVIKNNEVQVVLSDGAFIGEMSLVRGGAASAMVRAESQLEVHGWSKAVLTVLFRDEPELKMAFQTVLMRDMANKLDELLVS